MARLPAFSWSEAVVVVTGASRGIGREVALEASRRGARLGLVARSGAELEALAGDLIGPALTAPADVGERGQVEAALQRLSAELGPVDVLVANAGGTASFGPLEEMSEEDWRASVDDNLTATFLTLKSFLPGMKARRRASVITMSSAAGRRAHPRSPIAYGAAKAGIEMMTQHVASQVGPFGIRVNCIAPETIVTERNRDQFPDEVMASLVESHPLRRLGTPRDVARAAVFLASEDSEWITGVILDVAGGSVMVR